MFPVYRSEYPTVNASFLIKAFPLKILFPERSVSYHETRIIGSICPTYTIDPLMLTMITFLPPAYGLGNLDKGTGFP